MHISRCRLEQSIDDLGKPQNTRLAGVLALVYLTNACIFDHRVKANNKHIALQGN
jgi:hypothetical protein